MNESEIKKQQVEIRKKEPIFTEEEIENTIKAFILAWLHKRVVIRFPTHDEIKHNLGKRGETLSEKEASDKLINLQAVFAKNIEICCGTKEATEEERKKATSDLFELILAYNATGRLEGTFEEWDLKKKMDEFEKKLDATNNVVEQLVAWLIESENGYEKSVP